jgi:hypothetical protein
LTPRCLANKFRRAMEFLRPVLKQFSGIFSGCSHFWSI